MTIFSTAIQIVFLYFAVNDAANLQPRIFHGDRARSGQFPFFAFLEIYRPIEGKFAGCGGTLISDEWILTAAHCVFNAKSLRVQLGSSMLHAFSDTGYMETIIKKKNFHIYPTFIQPILWNDIALIHIPEKVNISNSIRPARLPHTCDSTENIEVIAMGHGARRIDDIFTAELNFATLKTLPTKECRKALPIMRNRKSIICASNPERNQTVYHGDSGGALIRKSDNTLIGITSFVQAKYEDGQPQGFTNVYSYLKWIREVTGLYLPDC